MSCLLPRPTRTVQSSYFTTNNSDENYLKYNGDNTRELSNAVVVQPFHFPETRQVWWDRKPQGCSELLHLTSKRNMRLQLSEKTLRLGIKHLMKSTVSPYDCFFIGSLFIDSREDAVEINIDRFDPGRDFTHKRGGPMVKVPSTVVPGDQIIPLKLVKGLMGAEQMITHSKQEFHKTFQVLSSRMSVQEPLSLSSYLNIKACCYAHTEDDEMILNIQVGAITMATSILATPVNPVPIIPTALARNLTGPLRLSDVQGAPKCGFLTMDHTRKLLLLLESDPKAYTLPLVGVWVSGPFTIHHPYIWACCVRFLHSTAIKDRVLVSANTFLLVHYSPAQTNPIFWECTQQDELQTSPFDLFSCYKNLHLPQVSSSQYPEPLCLELLPTGDTMNRVLFEQAYTTWNKQSTSDDKANGQLTIDKKDTGPVEPRPSPSPYPQQNKLMVPIIPEVSLSLSFDESLHDDNTINTGTILPVKTTRSTDQENRAPFSVAQRLVGKQVLATRSPQREPLRNITAQQINTVSVPENRSVKPSTIKTTTKKHNTKKDSVPRYDDTNNDNHSTDEETRINPNDNNMMKSHDQETKKDRLTTGEDSNQSRECISDLCDSGVGNSTKDDSFPVEIQPKTADPPDPYQLIMKQDQQIKELQQQINLLLLQQSLSQFSNKGIPTPPPTPVTDTSTESLLPPPTENISQRTVSTNFPNLPPREMVDKKTIGTNTPTYPPTENFAKVSVGTSTRSPPPKGRNSKVSIATSTGSSLVLSSPVKTGQRCTAMSPTQTRDNKSLLTEISFKESSPQCSSSRCVPATTQRGICTTSMNSTDQTINEDDIVIDNDTNHTLASSIHAVDICEYSPESSTCRQRTLDDDSSPVLGESASMIDDSQPVDYQYDSLLLRNEKQFYDNLLTKVKVLLSEDVDDNKTANVSTASNTSTSRSTVPTRNDVIQATVQELARLKGSGGNDTSSKMFDRQPSSTKVMSGLPRLNFNSMSIDDSMTNSVLQLNPVDANYLSTSQLADYRTLVKDYCGNTSRANSVHPTNDVNCTWNNLSMATQDYLQRYNFNGRKASNSNDSTALLGCRAPPSTPEPPRNTDNILDIERLRNLPKLL